jgi:site-specific recombinase XerD
MTPIAPHITTYLRERLAVEKRASSHTCDTYAYAFQLLFEFASRKLGVAPSQLHLEQIDAALVVEFLAYLQKERGNGGRTRNARLTAIKSFMRFMEYRVPSALDQLRRVLAIPMQRTDTRVVPYLVEPEYRALLDAPDPATRLGIRDRAMLHVAIAGGLRVSELVRLRLDEVTFEGRYVDLYVRGKGRRERVLSLWSAVATSLRAWLAIRGTASAPEMFLNAWGAAMTRSGFECVLDKHVAVAAQRCPSLREKTVSPHVLRHTCAFNMLRATGDIRKVALWLGHSTTKTAELFYLQSDPTLRIEALASATPPKLRPGKFRPPDKLIASLRGNDYAEPTASRRVSRRGVQAPAPAAPA